MKTTRDVTKAECHWLDSDIPAGTEVFRYSGCTYGCVGAGLACTFEKGATPFFELPRDALPTEWETSMPRADVTEVLADLDVMRRRFAELIVEANDRGMDAMVRRYCDWDEIAAEAEKSIREMSGITTLITGMGN